MIVPDPSATVVSFVARNIRTLDELLVLVELVNGPERWWDTATIAREVRLSEMSARRAVEWLAGRNLLEIRVTGDVRYRFSPGNEELRTGAVACVDAYRSAPVALVRAVSDAHSSARDFADAFRFWRDG